MNTFDFNNYDSSVKCHFEKHGWIIFKNVFSKDEIKNLRRVAQENDFENHKGDLFSHPKTSSIIYDKRIVSIVKELLDTDKPVYFGDSSCAIGVNTTPFHKDNADRLNQSAPDWQSQYTILRLGIYTQDHKNHSEGLALRDGSHNIADVKTGKLIYVPSEPGDLVLWSLRTTHAGTAVRFCFAPDYFPHEAIYWKLQRNAPQFLRLPREQERITFFISYAKSEDPHFERLINYSKTRTPMIELWANSRYDPEQVKTASERIKIVDFSEEARRVDVTKTNLEHVEIDF